MGYCQVIVPKQIFVSQQPDECCATGKRLLHICDCPNLGTATNQLFVLDFHAHQSSGSCRANQRDGGV
jgi:hypothetical protein